MKILELVIKNFGKCSQERILFQEGINVIYGENESGKTTIHTFIKAMLFGLERGRGRASLNDTFSRYEPWENPGFYAGILRFCCGGRVFRLERNFSKYNKKAELICEDDGEELSVEQGDLEMLLDGMTAVTYENTVAVGQLQAETNQTLAAELKNYAANYYVTGNSELDLNNALNLLGEKHKRIEKEEKTTFQKREQIREKLEQEASYVWRDIHGMEESLEKVREDIDDATWQEKERQEEQQKKRTQIEMEEPKSKWRIHPMELLGMLFVVIICFGLVHRPWNYLIAIVIALAEGLYIWNKVKDGKKNQPELNEGPFDEEEKNPLEKLQWEEEHLKDILREKQVVQGNLLEQIQELDIPDDVDELRAEKKKAIDLALRRMTELSDKIQTELGRDLDEKVSEILAEITDKKYERVLIDEELHMHLYSQGRKIPVEQVSRGTLEQVYFALRMASAAVLYEEEYPVVLDDTFVFYDDKRLEKTLIWLAEHKKQVLLFTCQKREMEALEKLNQTYTKCILCCDIF